MSNINRNNYEAFLLDYVEQNLSPEMVAELMLFLEQNPELKVELEGFENTSFSQLPTTKFEYKTNLKQMAIEEVMIAEIEGLNSLKESVELHQLIKENIIYALLFENYKKTILQPNHIIFDNKSSLKRKEAKVISLYYWIASAAAVLLLFFFIKNFNNDRIEKISSNIEPSQISNPQSTISNLQSPIHNLQSPIHNIQSPISNLQSPIHNIQSPIHNPQSTISNLQSPIHNIQSPISNLQSPISSEQLATNIVESTQKDSITIEPLEKQYIIIEPLALNEGSATKDDYLSVGELLKKEAQKRILATETKNAPTELVAANLVAKVFGKNAEIETKENIQGEAEEYALNIGGFSFSRKIRK